MFSEEFKSNSFETIVDFVSFKLDYYNVLFCGKLPFYPGALDANVTALSHMKYLLLSKKGVVHFLLKSLQLCGIVGCYLF